MIFELVKLPIDLLGWYPLISPLGFSNCKRIYKCMSVIRDLVPTDSEGILCKTHNVHGRLISPIFILQWAL